jgi:hypothetical protein
VFYKITAFLVYLINIPFVKHRKHEDKARIVNGIKLEFKLLVYLFEFVK